MADDYSLLLFCDWDRYCLIFYEPDIYGLLLFLNVDPLRVHQWFRQLVWEPYCHGIQAPMHHALAQVFWRTAKKDVIDQVRRMQDFGIEADFVPNLQSDF